MTSRCSLLLHHCISSELRFNAQQISSELKNVNSAHVLPQQPHLILKETYSVHFHTKKNSFLILSSAASLQHHTALTPVSYKLLCGADMHVAVASVKAHGMPATCRL